MLSGFTVPEPPVSTQQSSAAAENESVTTRDAPRTLWMGDLDPWLDEAAIVDLWFQLLGKKVTVKIIKPKNVRTAVTASGLSHSGYCFVEFQSYEDAQQALGLNGQLLPDRAMPSQQQFPNNPDNQKKYFRLNWASGATLTAPIVQSPEYSLFVGDLSASTTEAHLLAFFQKSFPNSIKTVRVMTDPVTGKLRCFGFVRFTDNAERQRALVEMNGAWFGGRPLRVALATPRSGNKRFGYQSIYPYWGNGAPYYLYGYGGAGLPEYGNDEDEYGASGQGRIPPGGTGIGAYPPPAHQYADPNNTTVFVGGLASDVEEQTLFSLFKQFGIIQQIKIPPGKNCGFVKYTTREEAENAIASVQGYVIGGNRVRLSWGRVLANNKKFHHQQQVAQAAQMEAAAALSMGMDPTSAIAAAAAAAAAAGYQLPMGMMNYHPGMQGVTGHPMGPDDTLHLGSGVEGQGYGQPPGYPGENLHYADQSYPGHAPPPLGSGPALMGGPMGHMSGHSFIPGQMMPAMVQNPAPDLSVSGNTDVDNLTSAVALISVNTGNLLAVDVKDAKNEVMGEPGANDKAESGRLTEKSKEEEAKEEKNTKPKSSVSELVASNLAGTEGK